MVTNTTLLTELVETGEKRDRIGRRITPAARRVELVEEWQASGLTQAEFARREGIIYSSFAAWVQAARRRPRRRPKPPVRPPGRINFIEATLTPDEGRLREDALGAGRAGTQACD